MKNQFVTIGLVQMCMTRDRNENLSKALRLVEQAAKKGAKIISLPELYRTHYFPQKRRGRTIPFHESVPGESTRAFAALARKYKVVIIVPLYENKGGKFYNSATVLDERGRLLPTYHKVHIPHDPNFYEKDYFERGTEYRVYKTKFAKFAVLICYDQWFPEAARAVALMGAEIIFYPTAIAHRTEHAEYEGDWRAGWQTVMRGHAIANAVYVAAVNRMGTENKLRFFGGSFVADSFGKIVTRSSEKFEGVLLAKVDLSLNKRIQKDWMFFKNRRPDTYAALVKSAKKS